MNLVSDSGECFQSIVNLMRGGAFFLNRIGGSDTNSVALYLYLRTRNQTFDCFAMRNRRRLAEKYNGFYDYSDGTEQYIKYCDELLNGYRASRHLLFCNYQLLSMYFPGTIPRDMQLPDITNREELRTLIEQISDQPASVFGYPYGFVEKLLLDKYTLYRAFETELIGKTVLVISPFSRSILANFGRKREFFRNYQYPDFNLVTLNTPITYSGLPRNSYPHDSWFETLDALKTSTLSLEFDIALLSCGSYAGPLGLHIESMLGKQAIYVGGVLQLYFGIMGRRYTGPFVQNQINPNAFIWPVERDDYLPHVQVNTSDPTEGFGAYF